MFPKDKGVAKDEPHDSHQTSEAETLGHHREHILVTHQTTVEQGETRQGHEQHEGGADHQETIVTRSRQTRQRTGRGDIIEIGQGIGGNRCGIRPGRGGRSFRGRHRCGHHSGRCFSNHSRGGGILCRHHGGKGPEDEDGNQGG